ncbi:hypothetical protein [Undibacterium sp. SXout20W]|uniref:hypothetical protein n=1 Tax=Undibacterium sp. SXout20W TaxID=3413051 RepID=UPI003BF3FB42
MSAWNNDYLNTAEELNDRGTFGDEISNLLEMQQQNILFNTPRIGSKPVLQLKYEMSRSEDVESFNEFKRLASVGLTASDPSNVLYAEIEFHDPLRPDQPPFYMAATLHLGAITQIEGHRREELKQFELLECASNIYSNVWDGSSKKEFKFFFRGDQFICTIEDDFSRSCEDGFKHQNKSKIISIRHVNGDRYSGIIIEGIV